MVQISDFSSVLEIAFAANGLMYLFDVYPKMFEEYKTLMNKYVEIENKHYYAGYKSYCNWGLMIFYDFKKNLLVKANLTMSAISLSLLIYASFWPEAKRWTSLMVGVLLLLIGVPLLSYAALREECTSLKWMIEKRTREFDAAESPETRTTPFQMTTSSSEGKRNCHDNESYQRGVIDTRVDRQSRLFQTFRGGDHPRGVAPVDFLLWVAPVLRTGVAQPEEAVAQRTSRRRSPLAVFDGPGSRTWATLFGVPCRA